MTRLARYSIWLGLPLVVAALVVLDPWLSRQWAPELARLSFAGWHPPLTSAVVVGTCIVTLAAFRAMRLAGDFATLSLALLLIASQLNGLGAGPVDIFDVVLFGTLGIWIATHAADVTRPIRLSVLLVLASGLVVLALAHLPLMSPVPWFIGVFGITRVAIIALLIVDLCRDLRVIDMATRLFVIVAVLSALIGIVQFTLAYLQIFQFTLIKPAVTAFKPTPIGFVMRASGLCATAQHFSSFLVYALPFALWRLADLRRRRDAASIIIILAGIAVSLNFGAMFAAILVIGLMPFLRWPGLAIHLGMGLVGVVSLAYFTGLLDLVYELSFGDAGVAKGVDQRKTLFGLGLEQFGFNPLVGTGLRGFGSVDGNFWDRPVHNLFGQAAVELGVFGLLIVLAIFFILSLEMGKLATLPTALGHRARTGLLLLAAAFVLGQSEPNLDQSNLWLVLSLAQAMVLTLRREAVKGSPAPGP